MPFVAAFMTVVIALLAYWESSIDEVQAAFNRIGCSVAPAAAMHRDRSGCLLVCPTQGSPLGARSRGQARSST